VGSLEELRRAKAMISEAAQELASEQIQHRADLPIGIMIEIPAAAVIADLLAVESDFFSIGTNDLIQYALAIDRGNREVAHLYNPMNPAVIRMVRQVADAAKDKGIKVFMCGEMAGDPHHIPILLGLGMDGLSMNPQSIPAVKRMVRMISYKDARRFMKDVVEQTSTEAIEEMVRHNFGSLLSNGGYGG
jgi:phosphotransferase system enzyme I (PtsI)